MTEEVFDKFLRLVGQAEFTYYKRKICSEPNATAKERIEKFFETGMFDDTQEFTMPGTFYNRIYDYDWDELLNRPDSENAINNLGIHFSGFFGRVYLSACDGEIGLRYENVLDIQPVKEIQKYLSTDHNWNTLREEDIKESAEKGTITEAVRNTYGFLKE
jgi:hypothetical protein